MKTTLLLICGAALLWGAQSLWAARWSFRAQRPADYAAERPIFRPEEVFAKTYRAEGMLYDYTGRVNARFSATIAGGWEGAAGFLAEEFRYSSGALDKRRWTLALRPDGKLTATAPDVEGEGLGEVAGNALKLTYRIKLPERAGGHVLDVTDWLYLQENGAILNRSEMRKFGVKAAELIAVMIPEAP